MSCRGIQSYYSIFPDNGDGSLKEAYNIKEFLSNFLIYYNYRVYSTKVALYVEMIKVGDK